MKDKSSDGILEESDDEGNFKKWKKNSGEIDNDDESNDSFLLEEDISEGKKAKKRS